MKRSLLYQIKNMALYIAIICSSLFLGILYTFLISYDNESFSIVASSISLSMLLMFFFIFIMTFNTNFLPNALQFGATRRGWYAASFISRGILITASLAFFFLVILPLANWFSGSAASQPSALFSLSSTPILFSSHLPVFSPLMQVTLLLCLCAAVSGYSAFVGYISYQYGMKWLVILILATVALFAAGIMLLGFTLGMQALTLLQSPWLIVTLLAFGAVCEILSWRTIRHIAVKG